MFLGTNGAENKKSSKKALFARNKLKSIGKVTPKALTDFNIGHKECELAINEERS